MAGSSSTPGVRAGSSQGPLGRYCTFEGRRRFPQLGINISVLEQGQVMGKYHRENAQEGFLVVAGECMLIVEEQERRLATWGDDLPLSGRHRPHHRRSRGRGLRSWWLWGRGVAASVAAPFYSDLRARDAVRRGRRARDDQLHGGVRRDLREAAAVAVCPLRVRIAARRRPTEPLGGYCLGMASPSAMLSQGQLAPLAQHGEERRAELATSCSRSATARYPLIAIIEGEAAILDAARRTSSGTARPDSSASRTCSPARPST